jgi:mycothiol synthase
MSNFPYTVRNYQPSDWNRYIQLNIEAEKLEPTGRGVSPQVIAEKLNRPNYCPEQDLFVVEVSGNIVGYLDVTPELKIGRVILDCWVHPQHRRRGLATQLFSHAARRAKELGAKVAHASIMEDNAVAKSVLSRLGFRFVRRFIHLRLDMTRVGRWDANQALLQCRHLQRGDEDKLAQIQNRSFADTWGYNPNTVEEIVYRINLSHSSPGDVVLAYDGDRVIGYCWTRITSQATSGKRPGQIFMLGVDPDCQGQGVGRRLLLAGLSYLESKGCQGAELTVDSKNTVARALYRSVGFKIRASSLWYEKVID